ncbi:MAG: glycosyltransferase family 4 protein [Reyranella sp.]|nr:glycosyltransferase family 4 protein [Reyranella sp.]MDP3159625.1 glycosyltransferase family 4 protein [Reyranella sp.]
MRIGFLISHPIQYFAPLFRELAKHCDLTVFYAHRQTAEQQARAGFDVAFEWDVDLLSGYHSKFLRNVARAPSTDRFFGCDTPEIAGEIANGGFDGFVVPGWALRTYWQAIEACRRAGVPVFARGDSQLVGPRSGAVRLAKAIAFRGVLRRFDGFLYVGQRNRDYLLHYGAPPQRLFFSPHCVDNDAFRAASEAAGRDRLKRDPASARRVLFVGKLIERKRPFDLLQAAARLAADGRPVDLAFAGSGEQQDALAAAAASSGVRAHFHGFVNQSELPAIYAAADVIVLPSDGRETWGLVVNEAMACGVPAVVSDAVGCGPDLIETGLTGAVFPLGNVAALADGIGKVLAFDPVRTRQALAKRMETYSPAQAAQGIAGAASALTSRSRAE